jgi:hypothetical protein
MAISSGPEHGGAAVALIPVEKRRFLREKLKPGDQGLWLSLPGPPRHLGAYPTKQDFPNFTHICKIFL